MRDRIIIDPDTIRGPAKSGQSPTSGSVGAAGGPGGTRGVDGGNRAAQFVNPDNVQSIAAGSGDGTAGKRRRGRPAGSSNKNKAIPVNVAGLEKLLVGTHAMLAAMTSVPELALDTEEKIFDGKAEATYLAESIKAVTDHYKVEIFDDKTIAWFMLAQCTMVVYAPRFYAWRERSRAARRGAPTPPVVRSQEAATVVRTEQAPQRSNGAAPVPDPAMRRGEVAGIGTVEFPPDHPMMGGPKH